MHGSVYLVASVPFDTRSRPDLYSRRFGCCTRRFLHAGRNRKLRGCCV